MSASDEDCSVVETVGLARRWASDDPGVVAIDVGRENMGVCVLRFPVDGGPAIETWRRGSVERASADTVARFFESLGFFDPSYEGPFEMVVERQVGANPTAVRIQAYTEMLFFYHGWTVFSCEPRAKFDGPVKFDMATREEVTGAKTYYRRKSLAVDIARRFLKADPGNALEWSEFFETETKRDDLADALMYALTHAFRRRMHLPNI